MTERPPRCSSWTETAQFSLFAFAATARRFVQESWLRSSSFRQPLPRSQAQAFDRSPFDHRASM